MAWAGFRSAASMPRASRSPSHACKTIPPGVVATFVVRVLLRRFKARGYAAASRKKSRYAIACTFRGRVVSLKSKSIESATNSSLPQLDFG